MSDIQRYRLLEKLKANPCAIAPLPSEQQPERPYRDNAIALEQYCYSYSVILSETDKAITFIMDGQLTVVPKAVVFDVNKRARFVVFRGYRPRSLKQRRMRIMVLRKHMSSRPSDTKLVDVSYESIEMETEKAILFMVGGDEVWIPRSILELDEKKKVITIPEWFAKKEDLA